MTTSRRDGRANDEMRPLVLTPDFIDNPLASVLCEMGRTRVLCNVSEEPKVPRWLKGRGEGWVTAEYAMLPAATDTRNERESSRGKVSGRTMEIQRLIGRSLRAVVDLGRLGERTLHVDCDVLQADGGTRTASITGAFTALALACDRLKTRGDLEFSALRDSVAAISVGLIDDEARLDLPYEEDGRAQVDMNVVATGSHRLVEIQGTGEGHTFSRSELDALTDLALSGVDAITSVQADLLGDAMPVAAKASS